MRSRMFYQIWRAPLGPLLKTTEPQKITAKPTIAKGRNFSFYLK